uniref:Protein MON2 homolog isoform X2 n=1 Tax=Dermatophagoides pteronyssinus TaxID=6956 RepID=A0A6P6YKN2_DERPT|nr:protein MON2 homolog isoform X2 [Dermatophagoides pteronyssinus]
MSSNETINGSTIRKFLDELQHNFNQLASESKKKFPHVKEACETGIIRVRNVSSSSTTTTLTNFKDILSNESAQLMEPFFMGCDTRWPKLVQISLNSIQKSILFECLNKQAAENLINCLWNLMEHNLEEVKVLQTITLLITTNQLIQDEHLAKVISLCFRLYNSKNSTTANTASATIRQLITAIFERVPNENNDDNNDNDNEQTTMDKSKLFEIIVSNDKQDYCQRYVPIRFRQTKPACMDAYNLMQDLIQIINGETTFWLKTTTSSADIGKLFALELLELIIDQYSKIFYVYDEFIFILKDKVCQVVIKLFAPNLKSIRSNNRHHHHHHHQHNHQLPSLLQRGGDDGLINVDSISDNLTNHQTLKISPTQQWSTTVRLMRIVTILIKNYFKLLITECEIFLSQLIRSLEVDKFNWQRLIALEALYKILDAQTLSSLCEYYDSSEQSSKILFNIINALCIFIQSQFQIIDSSTTQSLIASLVNNNNSGNIIGVGNQFSPVTSTSLNRTTTISTDQFPTFNLRNITTTLLFIPFNNDYRYKTFYIDQLDKQEPPQAPNGHGLSTGIACVFEVANSLMKIIENYLEIRIDTKSENNCKSIIQKHLAQQQQQQTDKVKLHRQLILSTYNGLIGSFSLLLDASIDEKCTELILDQIQKLIIIYGLYDIDVARDLLLISLCKSALPSNYCLLSALNPDNISTGDFLHQQKTNKSNEETTSSTNSLSTNSNVSSMAANLYTSKNLLSNSSINLSNLLQQQNNHPQSMNSNKSTLESSSSTTTATTNNNSSLNYEHNRQVIAVGTPLPVNNNSQTFGNNSTIQSQQQQQQNSGPVMLITKNLQCMHSIMHISMKYGDLFGEKSWHICFTTLQHLVWILGIKLNNSKAFKLRNFHQTNVSMQSDHQQQSSNVEQIGSTLNDLPVLTAMLSRLFECTQTISDDSLLTMIKALITISNEAMDIAYNNREPSLFAIVKIHETALVNLTRIDLFWDLITKHLIEISLHPYNKLRENSVEVICNLVQSILNYRFMKEKNEENSSNSSELYYLLSLQSLSQNKFIDIRQKQIECLLQILQTNGEDITIGWPILFNIIESACLQQNDKLVVQSFQCYEFIVSNLLRYIPSIHLIHCINVAVAFGSQVQELNVSLSAVGLVWNVADFLHSNHNQIQCLIDNFIQNGHKFVSIDLPFCEHLTPVQSLWISLFKNLSNLCTDARLSVRKSSVQTLMSTLSKHGQTLDYNTWKAIFFYILFPLVDSVRTLCSLASNEKITQSESSKPNTYVDDSQSYMIHYSRNTAFKQWCETQVSVINGVSRIISIKLDLLIENSLLQQSPESNNKNETILLNIWTLFFEFIYTSSTCANEEVSMSAIKCFNKIISFLNDYQANNIDNDSNDEINRLMNLIWKNVWKIWCKIGNHIATINNNKFSNENNGFDSEQCSNVNNTTDFIPSQSYLCLFIQPLCIILSKYIHHLTESDFKNMSNILQNVMNIPFDVIAETYHHTSSYRHNHNHHPHNHNHPVIQTTDNLSSSSSSPSSLLTNLQHEILITMEKIQTEIVSNLTTLNHLLPLIYYQYLTFSLYAVNIVPPNLDVFISSQFQHRFLPDELTSLKSATFYTFGELSLRNAFNLYLCTYMEPIVIKSHILHSLIKAYKIPLCFKYSCPLPTTWKYAVNYFIKTLELGLPLARRYPADFISIWADLALTFEGFLFPANKPPSNQKLEEQQMDESLDVKVVELIRDHIMIHAQKIPKEFLLQIVSILNRGSIHSPSITLIETEMNRKLREDFARICFQTLLQFSFFGPKGNPDLFIQSSKTNLNCSENIGQILSTEQTIGIVNKLAVASILKRFNDVIIKYVEDEQLCPCPLPRHRLSEISFVLKALATLIASLKEAPPAAVENHVWQQLINLYPRIVDCTMSNSPQVNNSIREVLHQYACLLQCPDSQSTMITAAVKQFESNGIHNHHQQQQQTTLTTKSLPTNNKSSVDIKSKTTEKNFQRNGNSKNAEINI